MRNHNGSARESVRMKVRAITMDFEYNCKEEGEKKVHHDSIVRGTVDHPHWKQRLFEIVSNLIN